MASGATPRGPSTIAQRVRIDSERTEIYFCGSKPEWGQGMTLNGQYQMIADAWQAWPADSRPTRLGQADVVLGLEAPLWLGRALRLALGCRPPVDRLC